jgi:predicted transglutaminase-like cysteine proteinase
MYTKRISMLMMAAGTVIALAGCQSTKSITQLISTPDNGKMVKISADMPVGQQVVPPLGFIGFCLTDPTQCEGGTDAPKNMPLTQARWNELNAVNDYVNTNVPQIEDIANYGVSEKWSYPNTNGGDCEDLALLKRKLLIERGWSPADLLIAVVREWNGEGHAILVADTDKGELVLDNKNWAIVAWNDTPYTWIKRQSRERPYIWVDLDQKTFRNAANDTLPPVGAPIPFVVAARQMQHVKPAYDVATADTGLRPSLAPDTAALATEKTAMR